MRLFTIYIVLFGVCKQFCSYASSKVSKSAGDLIESTSYNDQTWQTHVLCNICPMVKILLPSRKNRYTRALYGSSTLASGNQ